MEEQQDNGNWTVEFNSSHEGEIKFEVLNGSSSIDFDRLEYRISGSWLKKSASKNGDTITADWEGSSNPLGRIVFDVNSFDRYRINITAGEKEIAVYNPGRAEQQDSGLDVTNPIINYDLCSFSDSFWRCNPEGDEPGSEGEVLDLEDPVERDFEIPNNSEVDDFSIELTSIEDESLLNLTGNGVLFADISADALSEVLTYQDEEVKAFDSSGNSLWNYSTGDQVNDIESGNEQVETEEEEILAGTENSLILLSNSGDEIWRKDGQTYYDIATGELSSERITYKEDDSDPEGLACVGCSNETVMTLPYNFTNESGTFYVETGLNYYNKSADLKFELNDTVYDVDESEIDSPATFEYSRSSGNISDMAALGEENITFEAFRPDFDAEKVYLRLPLARSPSAGGDLQLDIGGNSYSVRSEDIDSVINPNVSYSTESSADGVVDIGGGSEALYTGGFDAGNYSSVYVGAEFNRLEGSTSDIVISLNDTDYSINGDQIGVDNIEEFRDDDGSPAGSKLLNDSSEATFNLHYDVPQDIKAEQVFVRAALSYQGEKTGEPYVEAGGDRYYFDKSKIKASSVDTRSIHDSGVDNSTCIGCNETESRSPIFDLSGLDVSSFEAERARIETRICSVGDPGNLQFSGSGVGDETEEVNTTDISSCSDSYTDVGTDIAPSQLSENQIIFQCGDSCNSTDHYKIAGDNSTQGTYSEFLNGTEQVDVSFDYMVNVSTNSSLDYDWTEASVPDSELETGKNISFGCESCSGSENYRLMTEDGSSGNSYYNNSSGDEVIDNDYMARVWTNTSLKSETAYTRVNSSDLDENTNISFSSIDSYNILYDKDSQGDSYRGGNSLEGEYRLRFEERPLNYSLTNIEVNESDLNSETATLSCESCGETSYYLGLDPSSSLETSSTGKFTDKTSGADARVWSNTSLGYDTVRTLVDGEDLEEDSNITYFVENSSSKAFNVLVDDDSSADSYIYDNGYENLSGGLMTRLEFYGSSIGDEIVSSRFPSVITALDSSGDKLWNYSTDVRTYSVDIGNVIPESTGNEVVVGTGDDIKVIDSTGQLIESFPTEGSSWFRSTTLEDIDSGSSEEIISGTDSGNVVALDSNLSVLWNQSLGDEVNSLESGNISKAPGTEVLAGLDDGSLVLMNSSGQIIETYQRDSSIREIERGDVLDAEGNELGVSTSDSDILNFYNIPYNLGLDIGNTGDDDWNSSGIFTGTSTVDGQGLTEGFNDQISNCSDISCRISMILESGSGGRVEVSDPEVSYSYNLSDTYEYDGNVTKWAKTANFDSEDKIMYEAARINYTMPPAVSTRVKKIFLHEEVGSQEVVFNGERFQNNAPYVNLPEGLRFWRFEFMQPRSPDYIWYDKNVEASPVEINRSDLNDQTPAYRNVTVSRATDKTSTRFENITLTIPVNDSEIVEDAFLEVDWNDNGTYSRITPSDVGCGEFRNISGDERDWKVCKANTDSDINVEEFRVIQPELGRNKASHNVTDYRVGGVTNIRPSLDDLDISPSSSYWGTNFEVRGNFSDNEGDDLNVTLWTDKGSGWEASDTTQTAGDAEFELQSEKNWTGTVDYKLEYYDYDENGPIHSAEN